MEEHRPPARPPDDSQLIFYPRPELYFDRLLSPELLDGTLLTSMTTKWFRELQLDPLEILPLDYPRASATAWRVFWTASIPHKARTILWRFYHKKLSCRSRLHHIIPSKFPNPDCQLCGGVENDEHFFWSCPVKRPIWSTLTSRFLTQPDALQYEHISQPAPRNIKVLPSLHFDSFTFVACAIIGIWRVHWKHVFDDTDFWPDEAAAVATAHLRRINREHSYKKK
ncbi:hypothetical protein G6F16_012438 [Rhizopus arrhizus]|nr:hypothetical protein G6F22_012111 [Rhizopus arrhizus]KAG0780049.1 hypothetical protein G6F21_012312 [Rhizopus arrhizus]KAG0820882.1 hypothetical protein G6F18_012429 [Rhizopus arrhizus]KAG0862566.1 hypothetical protein G6F16_012438 [Rhizopus arrhizus]KAG0867135.1 hypothetical protein G6F15_012482 [Rhizopus arrhizus]